MYVVREIMYCKPGQVRKLLEKFKAMNELMVKNGMGSMRILTDFCADQYWTLVAEMEVADLATFEKNTSAPIGSPEDMAKMGEIMVGYHDLVVRGKREIYKLET